VEVVSGLCGSETTFEAMCGLCGWIAPGGLPVDELIAMNNAAAHRGPDGEGYWCRNSAISGFFTSTSSKPTKEATVALGHRRLAILDRSQAGAQPMASPDRCLWMVLNGEIYNYIELRSQLGKAGHRFITSSDTEVALAAYSEWGTNCFERFNGMWGIAIVDLRNGVLILSRDRLGIKPLHVALANGALFFASEIKQLFISRRVKPVANGQAIVEYIDTGYETPPHTMFDGIDSFEPGCWSITPLDRPTRPAPRPFWRPPVGQRFTKDVRAARQELHELFNDAVRLQLRSDVPVGVCLSGGLDSSSIYGVARRFGSGQSVDAFSAGFDDPLCDERPFIRHVLDAHGGRLNLVFPTPESFVRDCDQFVFHHEEPVGSLSQYAAWSVMKLARERQVPVLLNGQGGDELFSGYWSAYYMFLRRRPWALPSHVVGSLLPGGNRSLLTQIVPHLHRYYNRRARSNREFLATPWRTLAGTRSENWALKAQHLDPTEYRLAELREIHLPRLLKWDDRNSMAFGIEGRYPFLDHRVVEFALSIPPQMNFHRGWNKMLVRTALHDVLPPKIQWRRSKNGFATPQKIWLSTALRPSMSDWLSRPSERLSEIVDLRRLSWIGDAIRRSSANPMDTRSLLFIRLFLLDRWMTRFDVALPKLESAVAVPVALKERPVAAIARGGR
jgi:asparagine synthase (glutamine-hydrolysing)